MKSHDTEKEKKVSYDLNLLHYESKKKLYRVQVHITFEELSECSDSCSTERVLRELGLRTIWTLALNSGWELRELALEGIEAEREIYIKDKQTDRRETDKDGS